MVPAGSEIEFYDHPSGGNMVMSMMTEEEHTTMGEWTDLYLPAKVLCRKSTQADDLEKKVKHLELPAFSLSKAQMTRKSFSATIQWNFEELDQHGFTLLLNEVNSQGEVSTIEKLQSQMQQTTYDVDLVVTPGHRYFLVIESGDGCIFYKHEIENLLTERPWKVINQTTDQTLIVSTQVNSGSYQLFSCTGQIFNTGDLKEGENTLSYAELPAGSYFLVMTSGNRRQTYQFVNW